MNIIKTKSKGNLIVISGPSGAGKDTIVNELLKINKNCWLSVSMTSRSPRVGEVDKINYYFVTEKEFEDVINLIADKKINVSKYIDAKVQLGDAQNSFERLTNGTDDAIKIIFKP